MTAFKRMWVSHEFTRATVESFYRAGIPLAIKSCVWITATFPARRNRIPRLLRWRWLRCAASSTLQQREDVCLPSS